MERTTEYFKKMELLKKHLIEWEGFTKEEANAMYYSELFDSFSCGTWEYKVFTEAEANEAVREEIAETLWAFNPSFILEYTEFYKHSTFEEDDAFEDSIKELQSRICEGANPIIKALIRDMDEFVNDAIQADGRGHFLATYDGEEIELNGGKYLAYRIN